MDSMVWLAPSLLGVRYGNDAVGARKWGVKISGQNNSRYGYDSGLHPRLATYRDESDDANQLILRGAYHLPIC